jgi:hypothetical protein
MIKPSNIWGNIFVANELLVGLVLNFGQLIRATQADRDIGLDAVIKPERQQFDPFQVPQFLRSSLTYKADE